MIGYWDHSQETKNHFINLSKKDYSHIKTYPPIDENAHYLEMANEYSSYPNPHDFVNPMFWESLDERFKEHKKTWISTKKPFTKKDVIHYLSGKHLIKCNAYMGWSDCRICGKMNGSHEWTDLHYIWPEGLAHYVKKHDVRLPDEFLIHIMNNLNMPHIHSTNDYEVDTWIKHCKKIMN
jgi:hypothetical protein